MITTTSTHFVSLLDSNRYLDEYDRSQRMQKPMPDEGYPQFLNQKWKSVKELAIRKLQNTDYTNHYEAYYSKLSLTDCLFLTLSDRAHIYNWIEKNDDGFTPLLFHIWKERELQIKKNIDNIAYLDFFQILFSKNLSYIELIHIFIHYNPKAFVDPYARHKMLKVYGLDSFANDEKTIKIILDCIDIQMIPELFKVAFETNANLLAIFCNLRIIDLLNSNEINIAQIPYILKTASLYNQIDLADLCLNKISEAMTIVNQKIILLPKIEKYFKFYMKIPCRSIKLLLSSLVESANKPLMEDIDSLPRCLMLDNYENSIASFEDVPGEHTSVNTVIYWSIVKLPELAGSDQSKKFLKFLYGAENPEIFKSDIIKYYLAQKWDSLSWIAVIHSCLLLINIPLLIFMIFVWGKIPELFWSFIIINFLLLVFEFCQACFSGLGKYFGNAEEMYIFLFLRVVIAILNGLYIYFKIKHNIILYILYIFVSILIVKYNREYLLKHAINFGPTLIVLMLKLDSIYFAFPIGALMAIADYKNHSWFSLNSQIFMIISFISIKPFNPYLFTIISIYSAGRIAINVIKIISYKENFNTSISLIVIDSLSLILFVSQIYFNAFYFLNSLALVLKFIILVFKIEKIIWLQINWEILSVTASLILIGLNINSSYYPAIILLIINLLNFFYSWSRICWNGIKKNLYCIIASGNTLDITRLILCYYWVQLDETNSNTIEFLLCLCTVIRGLTAFRAFTKTRYYVRLISRAIMDILPFIAIFLYSTLCFGMIEGLLQRNDLDFKVSDIFIKSYYVNLTEFDSKPDSINWLFISFFFGTMINIYVILNLLISILGDSFERFQLSASEIDLKEMTSVLYEIESIINCKRKSRNDTGKYLAACDGFNNNQKIWKGKLQHVIDEMKGMQDMIVQKIEAVEKENNEKFRSFEDKFNEAMMKNSKDLESLKDIIMQKFNRY